MRIINFGDLQMWVALQIIADQVEMKEALCMEDESGELRALHEAHFDPLQEIHADFEGLLEVVLSEESREYISLYAKLLGVSQFASLNAHGWSDGKRWLYSDSGHDSYLVQDWINARDGEFGTLVICACNPGARTPVAKKSLLLIPDDSFRMKWVGTPGEVRFSLIHPDDSDLDYTLQRKVSDPISVRGILVIVFHFVMAYVCS